MNSTNANSSAEQLVELAGAAAERGGRRIWSDLDLSVEPGEFIAVLGPNGAGKSTLFDLVLGLQPLAAGSASVLGGPPGSVSNAIGYLPQRRSFGADTRVRGVDLVQLGLDGARWGLPLPAVGRFGGRSRAVREQVAEAIDQVGAGEYAKRPIGECSGGQQQRLLIAQALIRRPKLLLLDEPLDSLDPANQSAVVALVDQIRRDHGVAVLLVAHDVNPLLPYVDRVLYIAEGRAVIGSPREVITSETLSGLYGTPIEVLEAAGGRLVVVGQPEAISFHPHSHDDR